MNLVISMPEYFVGNSITVIYLLLSSNILTIERMILSATISVKEYVMEWGQEDKVKIKWGHAL